MRSLHKANHLYFSQCYPLPAFLFFSVLVFINNGAIAKMRTQIRDKDTNNNDSVPALIVFGDSFVDPGNNNYIRTTARSNFPPYGRDFVNHSPTGRFTNGRLITDFLATYLGIVRFPPPYLNPKLRTVDLLTGVSFASAGTGYDPFTARISNVIPLSKQLEYFEAYKTRLEKTMGSKKAEDLIAKALFFVSAGLNDFILSLPIRDNANMTVPNYLQFLLQQAKKFIQELQDQGARKIAVSGIPPFGCLPVVITVKSKTRIQKRECIESYNTLATRYNQMLENEIKSIQKSSEELGTKVTYIDMYEPLMEIINNHKKFGFDVVSRGCCGTGYVEVISSCNPTSFYPPNVSKYVFWDAVHPTERAYFIIFKSFVSSIDSIMQIPSNSSQRSTR